MHRIKDSGNEWPKVRLAFHEHPLHLSVAGEKARYPNSVNLTDGGSYGQNKWYGRIGADGTFTPAEAARNLSPKDKQEFWGLLARMRDGEAEEVFAEFGKRFGVCCICGRELTNSDSVKVGIGPICRKKAFEPS
jgi:hypothetical protein